MFRLASAIFPYYEKFESVLRSLSRKELHPFGEDGAVREYGSGSDSFGSTSDAQQ
jgi:hypothetical protein